jgi:hypothetical protein
MGVLGGTCCFRRGFDRIWNVELGRLSSGKICPVEGRLAGGAGHGGGLSKSLVQSWQSLKDLWNLSLLVRI